MAVGVTKHTVGVIPYQDLKNDALEMTSWFETTTTGTECYGTVSANFDGAGTSFGIIQYNWKSGTLQPILKSMFNNHPDVVHQAIPDKGTYDVLYDVTFNYTTSQQVAWGDSITDWANDSTGHKLKGNWKQYFHDLGVTPECIALQRSQAQVYYDKAEQWKPLLKVWSRRGYGLLFDIAVQKGNFPQGCIDQCLADYNALNVDGMSREEIEHQHLKIIANRRTDYGDINSVALNAFRQRKMAIADGGGTVYGSYWSPDWYDIVLEPCFTSDVAPTTTTDTSGQTVASKPQVLVGATAINDIKRGVDQVAKAMLGTLMMWNKPVPQSFRYFKIQANAKNTDWNPTEIEILDANGASMTAGATVTCSTTTFDGVLANLINGDKTTGAVYFDQYETNQQNTITVDLGSIKTGIADIKINFAYGTYSGDAIISSDGVNWEVATYVSGSGTNVHEYTPGTSDASDLIPVGDTTAPVTTASPLAGTFAHSVSVTLTADDAGSTIYYTTDGTTPTTGSTKYAGTAITFSATGTLKYFAVDQYGNTEGIKSQTYQIGYRYVRELISGNSVNDVNTFTEFQVMTTGATNLVAGKLPMETITPTNGTLAQITDGLFGTTATEYCVIGTGNQQITFDLGQIHNDLDYIKVWHYYGGDRYYKYKLQVSADNVNWIDIYYFGTDGALHETASGNTHYIK